jgi:hypothetical protein
MQFTEQNANTRRHILVSLGWTREYLWSELAWRPLSNAQQLLTGQPSRTLSRQARQCI